MATESNQDGRLNNLNWLMLNRTRNYNVSLEPGGIVIQVDAAAIVLETGDAVFMSATGASKSTTAANYVGFLGIVVGGKLTNNEIVYGTGLAVTTGVAGEKVLVQISGVAIVKAGGTVTPGTNLAVVPDTGTAGKVIAGTTQGQMLGTTLTAGAAAADMKILLNHR